MTNIVEPSGGIFAGCGVSAQPKFTYFVPATVAPCAGVSRVPKGFTACALSTLIWRLPSSFWLPSKSVAMACNR